jgi:hypothetical protein
LRFFDAGSSLLRFLITVARGLSITLVPGIACSRRLISAWRWEEVVQAMSNLRLFNCRS